MKGIMKKVMSFVLALVMIWSLLPTAGVLTETAEATESAQTAQTTQTAQSTTGSTAGKTTQSSNTVQSSGSSSVVKDTTPVAKADDVHIHCDCGGKCNGVGGHSCGGTWANYQAWNSSNSLPSAQNGTAAYYYLTKDVDITEYSGRSFLQKGTLYLCLNGHTIRSTYDCSLFYMYNDGNLILTDCKGTGKVLGAHGLYAIQVNDQTAVLKVYGVTFSSDPNYTKNYEKGGAIQTAKGGINGRIDLYGCTFKDCYILGSGAAINVTSNGKSINIHECTFKNCTSTSSGGALNTSCTVNINNSTFDGCSAPSGGAIISDGTVNIKNSVFKNCSASLHGGAIYADGGFANSDYHCLLEKSTITDCKATYCGGAVYSQTGSVGMRDSVIDSCSAGSGGAVAICCDSYECSFVMESGTISNCHASNLADSVWGTAGYVTIKGGTIKVPSNPVGDGCGVYMGKTDSTYDPYRGSFTMSGGEITGSPRYASVKMGCKNMITGGTIRAETSDISLVFLSGFINTLGIRSNVHILGKRGVSMADLSRLIFEEVPSSDTEVTIDASNISGEYNYVLCNSSKSADILASLDAPDSKIHFYGLPKYNFSLETTSATTDRLVFNLHAPDITFVTTQKKYYYDNEFNTNNFKSADFEMADVFDAGSSDWEVYTDAKGKNKATNVAASSSGKTLTLSYTGGGYSGKLCGDVGTTTYYVRARTSDNGPWSSLYAVTVGPIYYGVYLDTENAIVEFRCEGSEYNTTNSILYCLGDSRLYFHCEPMKDWYNQDIDISYYYITMMRSGAVDDFFTVAYLPKTLTIKYTIPALYTATFGTEYCTKCTATVRKSGLDGVPDYDFRAGDTVTVIPDPDYDWYEVDRIYYVSGTGSSATETDIAYNEQTENYDFSMPESDVVIYVKYKYPPFYTISLDKTKTNTNAGSPYPVVTCDDPVGMLEKKHIAGTKITVKVSPKYSWYEMVGVYYETANGTEPVVIASTPSDLGTYTFSMPEDNITAIYGVYSIPKTYTIKAGENTNASTKNPTFAYTKLGAGADDDELLPGTEVTVKVEPGKDWYEFEGLYYKDVKTAEVTLISDILSEDNLYTFKMPEKNIEVYAVFIKPDTFSVKADFSSSILSVTVEKESLQSTDRVLPGSKLRIRVSIVNNHYLVDQCYYVAPTVYGEQKVPVTLNYDGSAGKYGGEITMPASNVTIYVTYKFDDTHHHIGEGDEKVYYAALSYLGGDIATNSDLYVGEDMTLKENLVVKSGCTVHLCLDGHTLTSSERGSIITVEDGARLYIYEHDAANAGAASGKATSGGTIQGRNYAEDDGGILRVMQGGTVYIYGGAFKSSHAAAGAAIYNEGTVLFAGSGKGGTISNCVSSSCGGAIYNAGTLKMVNGTISSNTASKDGGGIYNATGSTLEVGDNTTVSSNRTASGNGGNIFNASTAIVTGTVSSGTARIGAGIYNDTTGVLTVYKSTITSNTATEAGGGIYQCGQLTLGGALKISGNTANKKSSNLYLLDGRESFTVVDGENIKGPVYLSLEAQAFSTAKLLTDNLADNLVTAFITDTDRYYLRSEADGLYIHDRIAEQPSPANDFAFDIDMYGCTATYQWYYTPQGSKSAHALTKQIYPKLQFSYEELQAFDSTFELGEDDLHDAKLYPETLFQYYPLGTYFCRASLNGASTVLQSDSVVFRQVTADDFQWGLAPGTSLVYDGSAKTYNVAPKEGVPVKVTEVKYYDAITGDNKPDGNRVMTPTLPGTYYAFIDVEGTDNVRGVEDLLLQRELNGTNEKSFTIMGVAYEKTPAAPTVKNVTYCSVELIPTAGCEYSMDGKTWQRSTLFCGLEGSTTYQFYQRIYNAYVTNCGPSAASEPTTAKTDPALSTVAVSGTVYQSTGVSRPITGGSIRLTQGNDVFYDLVLDSTGSFLFPYVQPGEYNISVTDEGGLTFVDKYTVNVDKSLKIYMPADGANSCLSVDEDSPNVVVGGLKYLAGNARNNADGDVTVEMTIDSSCSNSAKTAFTSASGTENLTYLDITIVEKTAGDEISETSGIMEIVVPFSGISNLNMAVYRYHEGTVKTFTESSTKSDGTFYVDTTNNCLHLFSNKFSAFAIASSAKSSNKSHNVISGDNQTVDKDGNTDSVTRYENYDSALVTTVVVDNTALSDLQYSVITLDTSTYVSLKSTYIATLDKSPYALKVTFSDGVTTSSKFIVGDKNSGIATIDEEDIGGGDSGNGNGQSVDQDGDEDANFQTDDTDAEVQYVTVDGTKITDTKYTITKNVNGYYYVSLKSFYLNTLGVGPHTLVIYFTNGETATYLFTVSDKSSGNADVSNGSGNGQTVDGGGESDVNFRTKETISILSLVLDGEDITGTAKCKLTRNPNGYFFITLRRSCINQLAAGQHTLVATYSDKTVETFTFTIADKNSGGIEVDPGDKGSGDDEEENGSNGNGQSVKASSTDVDVNLRTKETRAYVRSVRVDGEIISSTKYKVTWNSNGYYFVSLKAFYVSTLKPGTHDVVINFTDDTCAYYTFTVADENKGNINVDPGDRGSGDTGENGSDGDNQTVEDNTDNDVNIRTKKTKTTVSSVMVDGYKIADTKYTVTKNSNGYYFVSLKSFFVKTLERGEHSVVVFYSDDTSSTYIFTIADKNSGNIDVDTGDDEGDKGGGNSNNNNNNENNGNGQTTNGDSDVTIRTDNSKTITSVKLDGAELATKYYSITKNSSGQYVTIRASYISTLTKGDHIIVVTYSDNTSRTYSFTVGNTNSGGIDTNGDPVEETVTHKILQGDKQTVVGDGTADVTMLVNKTSYKVTGVSVDDTALKSAQYSVVSNSSGDYVTVKGSYIKTLTKAQHSLKISFSDGYSVTGTFTVGDKNSGVITPPKTGDRGIAIYFVSSGAALAAAAAFVVLRRKKKQ